MDEAEMAEAGLEVREFVRPHKGSLPEEVHEVMVAVLKFDISKENVRLF